jgi:hypothetical protein
MTSEENWIKIKEHFLKQNDVQKQGESIKTKKKMFAMFNKGRYIVKLPKERVTELINTEKGLPYDPGNGKIMKEWVIIPDEKSEEWADLAAEAKKFAESLAK